MATAHAEASSHVPIQGADHELPMARAPERTLMKKPLPVLVSSLLLASFVGAQSPRGSAYHGPRGAVEASATQAPEDSVSGNWGIDFATAYFFRGLRLENQGLIAQPHLELDYTLTSDGDTVRSVDMIAGVWNSLHGGPTGASGGNQAWFESDFYWGLGVGLGEKWSASATYAYYTSPNASFTTAEEAVFALSYNDAGVWGEGFSGLQPAVTVGVELKGQQDAGAERGLYGQLAIEPSFGLGKTGDYDWTLAVPVALGLSLGDYYENIAGDGEDSTFGFLDVGAALSTPLPCVASRFGPWTMTVSLHALLLGDTTEAFNSGEDLEWIGALGFSTTF